MKKELDNKKMWEAMAKFAPTKETLSWINMCVESQGFKLNDNFEIVEINETPDFKIERGKWYMCIKDVCMDDSSDRIEFINGKLYKSEKDECLTNESGNKEHYWPDGGGKKEYFRPTAEEEIEDYMETKFKAGDVVMYVASHNAYSGLYLLGEPNDLHIGYDNSNHAYNIALRNCTLATDEQRKQFMMELSLNGYVWDMVKLRIVPIGEDTFSFCAKDSELVGETITIPEGFEAEIQGNQVVLKKKEEHKFKIGDFIVNDYCCGKVVELTEDAYLLDTEQGIPFSHEHNARLWDITKDAKDGDVLATLDYILIFKEHLKDNGGVSYCHYDFTANTPQFNWNEDRNWYFGKEAVVCPATKEQRDTLFSNMKEAGYMWLPGKKQLVKLLFKEGDTVKKKSDGSIWHISFINEKGYWYHHNILFPIENQNEFELVGPELSYSEVTKVSDQDELTELEKAVLDIISDHNTHTDSVVEFARRNANKLLSIARKQIISEVDPEQLTENFKQYVLLKEANGCDGPLISLGTDCYKRGIKHCLDEIELKGIVREE